MKRTTSNPERQRPFSNSPNVISLLCDPLFQRSDEYLFLDLEIMKEHGPDMAGFFAYLLDQYKARIDRKGDFDPFPLKHAQIANDLHMKEATIRRLKKILIEKGVISTKMKGVPAVEHYAIHKEVF